MDVRAASTPSEALGDWRPSGRVFACIPDGTRPLDCTPALTAVAERSASMRVVVGLGLHRPMTAEELAPLCAWDIEQHDPDDVASTVRAHGVPGAVYRPLRDADCILSIGVAEPHQYAGFSGGYKGVVIGCGGRQTIAALHQREMMLRGGVEVGRVVGNPFREAVDALGQALPPVQALVWVPGAGCWLAGEPRAVVRRAAEIAAPWGVADRRYDTALLRVPSSKGGSFYQASRAASYLALSPTPPLNDGARLLVDGAMPEGLGSEAGFRRALESTKPPWDVLLSGQEPTGAGAQRAMVLALVARRYRIEVVGCRDPAPLEAVGIPATRERPAPGQGWLVVDEPFTRIPQLG